MSQEQDPAPRESDGDLEVILLLTALVIGTTLWLLHLFPRR
jgi:hypothetical protein